MKKSKLLMPLTGIAAIGAIAPVAVMTACNKGEKEIKFINDPMCGTIIDKNTHMMTSKLGVETLSTATTETTITCKEYAAVGFAVTLINKFDATHKVSVTIDGKGTDGEEGTPFYVKPWSGEITSAQSSEDKTIAYMEAASVGNFLGINAKRIQKLYTDKKAEEFTFDAKYVETDAKGAVVGRQTVTYTVTACPRLHDCVVVNSAAGLENAATQGVTTGSILIGDDYTAGSTDKSFLKDADAALQDIKVTLDNELTLTCAEAETGGKTMTIAKEQTFTIPAEACRPSGATEWIYGNTGITLATGTDRVFKPEANTFFAFTFSVEDNSSYVESSWTCSYAITTTKGITVDL